MGSTGPGHGVSSLSHNSVPTPKGTERGSEWLREGVAGRSFRSFNGVTGGPATRTSESSSYSISGPEERVRVLPRRTGTHPYTLVSVHGGQFSPQVRPVTRPDPSRPSTFDFSVIQEVHHTIPARLVGVIGVGQTQ